MISFFQKAFIEMYKTNQYEPSLSNQRMVIIYIWTFMTIDVISNKLVIIGDGMLFFSRAPRESSRPGATFYRVLSCHSSFYRAILWNSIIIKYLHYKLLVFAGFPERILLLRATLTYLFAFELVVTNSNSIWIEDFQIFFGEFPLIVGWKLRCSSGFSDQAESRVLIIVLYYH